MRVLGSQDAHVYSLDAQPCCYYWDWTAITVAQIGKRNVALFGDRRGHAYSVDAVTGETIWKVAADNAPNDAPYFLSSTPTGRT